MTQPTGLNSKQTQLSQLTSEQIKNDYVAKVKAGKYSLILPLGARATLYFRDRIFSELKGKYTLELLDISGEKWSKNILIP